MFETGVRQFRLAMAMVWGHRISPRLVEQLIQDAVHTLEEFGSPGADVEQLLDGPFSDPEARWEFQTRALRRTVRRLCDRSPFYAQRLADTGLDAHRLNLAELTQIPVTTRAELTEHQQRFLCRGSAPYLTTRTTGSTGKPAEIWLSRYEAQLWPALAGLSGLLRGEISPADHMQVNISSRATAAVQQNVTLCRLVGARARVLGVIRPDHSLDSLLAGGDAAPTLLATYPSYLAELLTAAQRRGLQPNDFRLRRIDVGGEVLSPSVASAARAVFGVAQVNDTFAMTEVLPVSGRTCSAGHLHHDINMGLVEIIHLDTGQAAAPGELGSLVITPFYPYRECMPVLRYDTRDVVRCLPTGALTCDLAGIPASSAILGKADNLLRSGADIISPRDVVEVVEAFPSRPWPARFRADMAGGRLTVTLPAPAMAGVDPDEVSTRFAARGFHLDARLAACEQAQVERLRPLRSDLLETTTMTGI